MAEGSLIGCFGLTEADFGSNPGGMLTRAKKDGDEGEGHHRWAVLGRAQLGEQPQRPLLHAPYSSTSRVCGPILA